MHKLKLTFVIALLALGISGCPDLQELGLHPLRNLRDAIHGEPRINDNVFMLRNGGQEDDYTEIPSVIPSACLPVAEGADNHGARVRGGDSQDDSNTKPETERIEQENHQIENYMNSLKGDDLILCVDAMKLLIDTRWAHFEHVLNASISSSNFFVDATVTGLATSIPLVATGTKNVLGAIAGGLSGTRKNFNEDVLYSYSVQTIMQQMKTDRAAQASVINARLNGNPKPYDNMYEAASDLFEYDQAGSWDHAMASLQSNVAAQTAACQARLRDQKLNIKPLAALPITADSTATDPCNSPKVKAGLTAKQAAEAVEGITVGVTGKNTVSPADTSKLDDAVAIFATGDYSRIEVTGTATPNKNAKANKTAADGRAKAVIAKLGAQLQANGMADAEVGSAASDLNGANPGARIKFIPKVKPGPPDIAPHAFDLPFDADSHDVKSDINLAALYLEAMNNPKADIVIHGGAATTAKPDVKSVSDARAMAVFNKLKEMGVAADRLLIGANLAGSGDTVEVKVKP